MLDFHEKLESIFKKLIYKTDAKFSQSQSHLCIKKEKKKIQQKERGCTRGECESMPELE
jgi:hypothetical protein